MKFRGKFTVIILAFAFIVASAYIANAQQASPSEPAVAPGNGAVRVDRDFGAFHKDDQNQFGDDLRTIHQKVTPTGNRITSRIIGHRILTA